MSREVHVLREVEVPENVVVEINGMKVVVKGPKGSLERDFSHARGVRIRKENSKILVETYFANRKKKALVGTIAAHIRNMITGVTKGYRYKLKIMFSHFPISVKIDKSRNMVVIANFLGEKAPRTATILEGVDVTVKGSDVIVEGIDIEKVGQTAANIESACKVQGLDRRVFLDGIYIYEKGVAE